MESKWSDIPKELLIEITTLIKPLDIFRLTAVCSSWRHILRSQRIFNRRQNPTINTSNFPLIFNGFTIGKRSILLLAPPSQIPTSQNFDNFDPWIIKFEQKNPNSNIYHPFYPLSNVRVPVIDGLNESIDMLNARINDVGCEYIIRNDDFCYVGDFVDLIKEKVVFMNVEGFDRFIVLSIHVSGKLVLFDSVVNRWRLVNDEYVENHAIRDDVFDDVIVFNGDFYAVDCRGRIVLVNVGYNDDNNNNPGCPNDVLVNVGYSNDDNHNNNPVNLDLVAKPFCGGDKKRLVEIGDELMLVDVYMGFPPFGEYWDKMEVLEDYVALKKTWFKVFRLDKELKDWVEVKELGEYILFVGLYSSFSVSVEGLSLLKGNCIYFAFPCSFFTGHFNEDDVIKFHCGGVYNMEDGAISYSNLFWPPPRWLISSS